MLKNNESLFTVNLSDYELVGEVETNCIGRILRMRMRDSEQLILCHCIDNIELSPDELNQFYREIYVCMRMKHKAFLSILGLAKPEESMNIPMSIISENMANGSYQNLIDKVGVHLKQSMMDKTQMSCFFFRLSFAMVNLHRHHIIHGNLRPQTIFVSDTYEPYIAYQGIKVFNSLFAEDKSNSKKTVFEAPEVLAGSDISEFSDVYAYGVLLYRIFAKDLIYIKVPDAQDGIAKPTKISYPPNLTPLARTLLIRCLSKKPNQRPKFNEILTHLRKSGQFFDDIEDPEKFLQYQTNLLMPPPMPSKSQSIANLKTTGQKKMTPSQSTPIINEGGSSRSMIFNQKKEEPTDKLKNVRETVSNLNLKKKGKIAAMNLMEIQTYLMNLTSNNIEECTNYFIYAEIPQKSYTIAQNIFVLSSVQHTRISVFVELAKAVIDIADKKNHLDKVKQYFLDFLTEALAHGESFPRDSCKLLFINNLLRAECYTPEEIVHMIKHFYKIHGALCQKSVCLLFTWFAPYISAINQKLFTKIYRLYETLITKPNIPDAMTKFFENFETYKANDWEIFHKILSDEYDNGTISKVLRDDDVKALKELLADADKLNIKNHNATQSPYNKRIVSELHVAPVFAHDKPTLILYAALFQAVKCFQYLQLKGASLTLRDDKYRTISMFASAGGSLTIIRFIQNSLDSFDGALQTCAAFHQNYIFPNVYKWKTTELEEPDRFGKKIITTASGANNISVFLFCLKHGIPVTTKEAFGWTTLHTAAEQGMKDMVEIIYYFHEIDPNVKDTWGVTALHLAADRAHPHVVKFLLRKKRINVNARDSEDRTPLLYAVECGVPKVVKCFMKCNRVDFNAQNNKGITALHLAVKIGNVKIIRMLLENNQIDFTLKDYKNRTALDIAKESTNPGVKQLFEEFADQDKKCNVF